MTVEQLVQELQSFPPDMTVVFKQTKTAYTYLSPESVCVRMIPYEVLEDEEGICYQEDVVSLEVSE